MPKRIEDYALIGNCETAALIARDGSMDWLCLPRYDSAACFAALLGRPEHGHWQIAPDCEVHRVTRRYAGRTLILETIFETEDGAVQLTDFLARRDNVIDVVRIVRGLRGRVRMRTELVVRYEYGSVLPWASRHEDGRLMLMAGPDRLILDTSVAMRGKHFRTLGEFDIAAGEEVGFTLSWTRSYQPIPEPIDRHATRRLVQQRWVEWSQPFQAVGEWSVPVLRSILTLKALAHWRTGGIVAAATTSLPEKIGGPRNWDYRYCWLRDATLTLYALIGEGFLGEAEAWRTWLLRAVGGTPSQLQIMYGVAGERRLEEYEVPWLPGYENSSPVRIGNAAAGQVQLDVYGEVIDALYVARKAGLGPMADSWSLECALMSHLEKIWDQPDDGIWEMRGGRRHFTHSKVMAWVAFDRAVRTIEEFGTDGPLQHWRAIRDRIHSEVCEKGFNAERNSFVQSYDSTALDASLLLIPSVGFLPAEDPRVIGTVAAIERDLVRDGFVMRYDTGSGADGLPPGEGAFLACSFWLADNYILLKRYDDARALFERLLALRNDVGLLAEEYDPVAQRQLGNFPQAFSHLALINTARNLTSINGPVHQRARGSSQTDGVDKP
ncbi:MAG TPA: glycoside hydrolase family 15 protein [Oxalicibacterium sp.]|nr:glycoside hydrolase family 15 protein [Oxalicibacterium sp.]